MGYAGLPATTPAFLAGLAANNTRDWFEDHRAEYERDWLAAGLDLIAALSGPAAELGLLAVPRLNASLRRIHRDVRFSRDKRPYEPRLHLILSTGEAFNRVPGVHLVIGAQGIGFGGGHYGLEPEALERYRQAVSEPFRRAEFLELLQRAARVGADLDPPELARAPKGHAPAPWDDLIRRKSVIFRSREDLPFPDWLFGLEAVEGWRQIISALAPATHWLARLL